MPFGVADELSCYYDAPAEPCTVHIEVRVPGRVDEPRLRRAVGAALAAQPRAMVRRAPAGWWSRGYSWEVSRGLDADPLTVAAWSDEGELETRRARFLSVTPPLDSSPPLRILLAAGPGEDRVILSAHHAALDGLSCLELLRSISRHYCGAPAEAPAQGPPPVTSPSPVTSPGRDGAAPAARGGGLGLLPKPAARIAADHQDGPARDDRSGYGFVLVPGQHVMAIRQAAREYRVTVNDLLITALIMAVSRWNAGHGRAAGRIRITMPVNARGHDQASATGNLSRLTTVTARALADGDDPGALVADVAGQTRAAKDHAGPQVDPISRALATAWCPAAVKRRLLRLALRTAGPLLCDTSLVSNLGIVADPPRFGDVAATDMWFSTSAHMPRGLSVGVVTISGKLHLCFRYRRALFGEPAAVRFADAYNAALNDITNPGGSRDGRR
jgi:NRPS condensation-like uncharacterized protein